MAREFTNKKYTDAEGLRRFNQGITAKVNKALDGHIDKIEHIVNTISTDEDKRVNAENKRVNNENTRIASEKERVTQENTRKLAENNRVANESVRVESENIRKQKDVTYTENEKNRANSFSTLFDAMTDAKNTFIPFSDKAIADEKKRVDAETKRQSGETQRIKDETIRVNNESKRNITHSEQIIKVDNKLSQLQTDYDATKNEVIKKTDDKILEVEKRFNQLTTQQQQDSEVIDARDGETSLNIRLNRDKQELSTRISDIDEVIAYDYSSENNYINIKNSKEGTLDNVRLEGNTVVNIIPKGVTGEFSTDNYSTQFLLPSLATVDGSSYMLIVYGISLADATTLDISSTSSGNNVFVEGVTHIEGNNNVFIFTPNNKDFDYSQSVRIRLTGNMTPNTVKYVLVKIKDIQNPPSYFEGIKSVGDLEELELSSCNENLLDLTTNLTNRPDYYKNVIFNNNFTCTSLKGGAGFPLQFKIKIEKNKEYVFKCSELEYTNTTLSFYVYGYYNGEEMDLNSVAKRGVVIKQGVYIKPDLEVSFNSGDFDFLGIGFYYKTSTIAGNTCTILEPIISSSNINGFTPHKSDKKKLLYRDSDGTWKPVILRKSSEDNKDYIEELANTSFKYYKKCGEFIYTGKQEENWTLYSENGTHLCIKIPIESNMQPEKPIKCNLFPHKVIYQGHLREEGCYIDTGSKAVFVRIAKTKANTVENFKKYLQSNNMILVCQLAQEEVYDCIDLSLNSFNSETSVFTNSSIPHRLSVTQKQGLKARVETLEQEMKFMYDNFNYALKQVLAGDMQSLAYMLYPQDFTVTNSDDTNEDTPTVIPL